MRFIPLNLHVQIWDSLTATTHQKIALLSFLTLILIGVLSFQTNSFIFSNFFLGTFSLTYCKDMEMSGETLLDYVMAEDPCSDF